MYHNAITPKSLPRVADMSRRKPAVSDIYEGSEDCFCQSEEEALESLNNAVKKLHKRLNSAFHYEYVPSLEVLISIR